MPMSIVYAFVYIIWRGLLFIISFDRYGDTSVIDVAIAPRLFCVRL